jgi:hypothetical protein
MGSVAKRLTDHLQTSKGQGTANVFEVREHRKMRAKATKSRRKKHPKFVSLEKQARRRAKLSAAV